MNNYINAKNIILKPIDSKTINAENAKIECFENNSVISEEPKYPKDFSMSFTCKLNSDAIDYLLGNKRERYETASIYRYSRIKKSRKKTNAKVLQEIQLGNSGCLKIVTHYLHYLT